VKRYLVAFAVLLLLAAAAACGDADPEAETPVASTVASSPTTSAGSTTTVSESVTTTTTESSEVRPEGGTLQYFWVVSEPLNPYLSANPYYGGNDDAGTLGAAYLGGAFAADGVTG
jgi:hypothetical protein